MKHCDMRRDDGPAPGAPGTPPTWCSSDKEMVGCSLGTSRVWFTIGGGIVNEVYYPRVDIPQIRDLGFVVADGRGFWVEVKRPWRHTVELIAPGIPAVRVVHRHERASSSRCRSYLVWTATPCWLRSCSPAMSICGPTSCLRRIWAARGFWRRYNDDGYGEHDDDSPFDGRGRGRPWPLLTGERGHYEIARGRDPLPYLEAMARMALPGGMLPEQVWDAPPIAQRGLNIGRPTGSARPLAWAHAQYLKLLASRALGCPFDRPEAAWQRYRGERCNATRAIWSEQARISTISVGDSLLVTLCTPASVRWGFDGWQNIEERPTTPNHQGLHVLPIDTAGMIAGQRVDFAFRYSPSERWIGIDYRIDVMSTA